MISLHIGLLVFFYFGGHMKLFSKEDQKRIDAVVQRSKSVKRTPKKSSSSMSNQLAAMAQSVLDYFKDSKAELCESKQQLHEYIDKIIECGYAGIDTETTGLDRIHDWIVGCSLYYPGGNEIYIPNKHLVPLFEQPYKNQLSYEDMRDELQRLVYNNVKLIFANADFDLAMIYKDYKVDLLPSFYYDVILAWRCLKENEPRNGLKELYYKYPMGGKGDPKRFSDFFTPELFPYCKPQIAKLYAGYDARITFNLFLWQLPYTIESHRKCKNSHLEDISRLIWNIEFPMVSVCQNMHRIGIYLDIDINEKLKKRYHDMEAKAMKELREMVQKYIDDYTITAINARRPFNSGDEFNPKSPVHVSYLLYTLMGLKVDVNDKDSGGTGKKVLERINLPVTNKIMEVRSLNVLINTFVDKLPKSITDDSRIHAQFKQIGADCIVGDSIIPTSGGYHTIQDICESYGCMEAQHVDVNGLTIVNKNQQFEEAFSVIKYTDYPTIKITTEMGFELEGTFNHPIMVSKYTADDNITKKDIRLDTFWDDRRFKKLEDVSIGDYVEIPCDYDTGGRYQPTGLHLVESKNPYVSHSDVKIPYTYDELFAEFLGMYHADGSASFRGGTYRLALYNDDTDVIQRYQYLASELFNVDVSVYDKHEDINEVASYINCIQLQDIDRIISHGKQNKKIPQSIWISPRSVINAYIRGMTLDSSVYMDENDRVKFQLSICDKQDARLIQMHLASQGILCYISWNHNKGWESPRLSFNADNYMIFRDTIGFIESRKIMDTRPCAKNQYCARRIHDSFRVKVNKIEIRNNTVYDLHVPNTHSFISNGLISHNTGRMSSAEPNLQNIPSHASDIRHMFTASPGYVMMSSDYSQQEPKITAFVSQDKNMLDAFLHGRDIYATIASIAFGVPYEQCLEFHPETHEYQPDGKNRRNEAKKILLGVTYGRTIPSIAEQLYGHRDDMTDDEKVKATQEVYDAVMKGFPALERAMLNAQGQARKLGYTTTILGRRRHIPDMQLDEYEFEPMKGYVNPDIDPLDSSTLHQKSGIPERVVESLKYEFSRYRKFGQVVRRTKELARQGIRVVNNKRKIGDAKRQCLNSVIQGSAAEMTKMAMLKISNNAEWKKLGGRLLVPVHDELICEFPIENYKRGAELLSSLMSEAGDFLPFPINCDVEITRRWYGLEFPCPYDKPDSLTKELTESEIKWVQYMLYEREYLLPLHKEEFGDGFRGDIAKGVDGIWTSALEAYIIDYINQYGLQYDEFINHIEKLVLYGTVD